MPPRRRRGRVTGGFDGGFEKGDEAAKAAEEEAPQEVKKKKRKPKDGLEIKSWRMQGTGYNGSKVRNVPFSDEENDRLLKAIKEFCQERNIDEAALKESLHKERQERNSWARIAHLAGLECRSVWSVAQRIRRILWGKNGRWTTEQVQLLVDEVTSASKPSWKRISEMLGVNPTDARDKWREFCGGNRRKGPFSNIEDWTLRMAICEVADSLLPTSDIQWSLVKKWLPHRTHNQLLQRWYKRLLPLLMAYEDKHGYPLDPDIFVRLLVRKLRKTGLDDPRAVEWTHVNTWWSADMNRRKWKAMARRVPDEMLEEGMRDQAQWYYESLHCKGFKKRDKRVLKHAIAVLEREAMERDDDDEDEEKDEEAAMQEDQGQLDDDFAADLDLGSVEETGPSHQKAKKSKHRAGEELDEPRKRHR